MNAFAARKAEQPAGLEERRTEHPSVFGDRKAEQPFEKRCIGRYTADYLRKNSCNLPVAVDGGSSNLEVLRGIHKDVQDERPTVSAVLTNHLEGISIAADLREDASTIWFCTGGVLRQSRAAFADGADTAIREHNFWMAVVGANGFKDLSFTTGTQTEHPVKRAMIKGAHDTVIFPIDSSKWGKPATTHLHTIDEIVSWGKKVVLVTCYPVQGEEESNLKFTDRLGLFLKTATDSVLQTKFEVGVFTAPLSPAPVVEDAELLDAAKLAGERKLSSEVQAAYHKAVGPGEEEKTGLVITFRFR